MAKPNEWSNKKDCEGEWRTLVNRDQQIIDYITYCKWYTVVVRDVYFRKPCICKYRHKNYVFQLQQIIIIILLLLVVVVVELVKAKLGQNI